MQPHSQFSLWSVLKIPILLSTRISYSLRSFSNIVSFSDCWPRIAALEQVFRKMHSYYKIFLNEKDFCFWDYSNLSWYILCIFSEMGEKLVCKTVVQPHFGHVVRSLSEPLGRGLGRGSLCWAAAASLPWKRTKLSGRKIFILRVDSGYIK